MIVYRLGKLAYARELSGIGAKLYGGRWNSKGLQMLYTSESRALCLTEVLVHLALPILPKDYMLTTIELPATATIGVCKEADLPAFWKQLPHHPYTQKLGDAFIQEGKSLAMKVPSAVVRGDFNYLLNPLHPAFDAVKVVSVEAFEFDSRLFNFETMNK